MPRDYFQKSYFRFYPHDAEFFDAHIKGRLPDKITDAHIHVCLPKHVAGVTPETIAGDWAAQCACKLEVSDAERYAKRLFPGVKTSFVLLPTVFVETDTAANNAYVASFGNKYAGLMSVRPQMPAEQVEREFVSGGFRGFKPYPYMASGVKGAEVSVFDFMPESFFKIAAKYKSAVLLHLPRAGRMPDKDNIREIREILNKFPEARLVIAHFGRCFCAEHFERALELLGRDVKGLYFDTAAVLNPAVYRLAFDNLDCKKIIFGTDMPVMLWHGKREWKDGKYFNLCREDFPWNAHKYPDEEKKYTFYIYEQIKNILDAAGNNADIIKAVFYGNAETVYGKGDNLR